MSGFDRFAEKARIKMATLDALAFGLTLAAALGCGLIAGVFFAFSSFVMRALGRLPVSGGMAAMQSINVVVLSPVFLGVFVGTAVVCLAAIVIALLRWQEDRSVVMLAGGACYVVGTFLITIRFNVPWNNALAGAAADDPAGANLWADYLVRWTRWNHVRTAAAIVAAALFTLDLAR